MTDPIDRLAAYRPTTTILDAEWGPSERALLRDQLMDQPATQGRLRFVPRRRWPAVAAIASGAALVAALAGVVIAVASGRSGSGTPAGVVTKDAGDGQRIGARQFAYRAATAYSISADGKAVRTGTGRDWVSPDGTDWSIRTGRGIGAPGCFRFPFSGDPSFQTPTQAFFDSLPTDVTALGKYVRAHVGGSNSRDEAVFVAAGDMLRYTDLLASRQLRAAYVQVLARTGYVALHGDATDQLGRPAVRADFLDPIKRPGQIDSLYFDPRTYQLLEERYTTTGPPSADPVPSRTYSSWISPGPRPDTPAELSGPGNVIVMTDERVVDALPPEAQACTADH